MTKIDIFSGFLGAGKTTLIKKMLNEAYYGEKLMLIENEFGEIGIDGGFMQDTGIQVTEMNSGCICCSLVGDFGAALKKALNEYHPDRILIEPSGVGKLSDVIRAVQSVQKDGCDAVLGGFTTVVDANKCKMYMKNFGEFFNDQVENASCIILSHTDKASAEKLETAVTLLKEKNATATVVTAVWDSLDGKNILSAMEKKDSLQAELDRLAKEVAHRHGECDDPDCCCHHDHEHHHEHGECCHHDHEHHHEHGECCHHEHEHHHEHGECCHHDHEHHHEHGECCHHDHEHHHHHADEVFTSWGKETTKKFNKAELESALASLDGEKYGVILRAKGIVEGINGWLHFDYVPGSIDVREGSAGVTGRLCVIGCDLKEKDLATLFKL